jgi:cytochrome d ubiquinol oxidase subunit II
MVIAFWQNAWFIILVAAFGLFSVLDGFDLGAGMVVPFIAKSVSEKRQIMNALAPVWDGNEVWLIVGGGGLFAAFAPAFAAVLSGFYTAVFLVIVSLVLRAASFEFWSHSQRHQRVWEILFAAGSLLVPLLLMVALGNALVGVPFDDRRQYIGGLAGLLRPLPLSLGLLAVSATLLHGLLFLSGKLGQDLSLKCMVWATRLFWAVLGLVLLFFAAAPTIIPAAKWSLAAWTGICLTAISLALVGFFIAKAQRRMAFAASTLLIVSLWVVIAGLIYPWLIRSNSVAGAGYSILTDASSVATLRPLGLLAIGVFVVVGCSIAFVYRVFRGKVDADGGY